MTHTNECACGRPTAGAHLCDRCSRTFSYALVNTAAYTLELDTVAGKQTRYGDPAGGTTAIGKEQPLPVDGRFLDRAAKGKGTKLRHDVDITVTAWVDRVTPHAPPPENATTVAARILHLSRQLRWILRQPWCAEMLADFLGLERRLTTIVDRPPDTWYAGKCTAPIVIDGETYECQHELYARVDKGFIDCPGCHARHDVGARRDFLLTEAQNYHVTATEAAQALIAWTDYDGSITKLVDRIRKWRDRDLLEIQDVTELRGKDRHLYRLGDIQQLLIDAAQQQQQTKRVAAS